jgi:hypothetical protein
MHTLPDRLPPTLPLVVQVGFAGSRLLYGSARVPAAQADAFDAVLLPALVERLKELPARLGLAPQHRLCGVAQVAIGADTLFAQALQTLALPLRVRLPQAPQAFLAAGEADDCDFTPAEQERARALLHSPLVIEVRVASDADDRIEQFEDTNLAILRESDVVVCLLRAGAIARGGGTRDLMQRAARAGKAVLLLEVSMAGGAPVLSPWSVPALPGADAPFTPPGMPAELRGFELAGAGAWPSAGEYIESIRRFASAQTRQHSGGFRRAALAIIVLHIVATVLAAVAGMGQATEWVALLLAIELVLLGIGLRTHDVLQRSLRVRSWAVTRLLAETLRSMKSVSATAAPLDYPLALALPTSFAPLLRTAAVLHALDLRRGAPTAAVSDWAAQRARYVDERLTGSRGQLRYFGQAARVSAQQARWAHRGFWLFSVAAFVATGAKLASVVGVLPAPLAPLAVTWGGLLAITLPVAAVGFLSWAAASDLEARAATYAEMQSFLAQQVERLQAANSQRDFARAVRETELGILGENLGWFSRRLFRGVA